MKTVSKSSLALQTSIIFLVSFGVYFNTLFNSFVYDDLYQVINNPWIRDPGSIGKIFSSGAWGFNDTVTNYYRPIMHIIYMCTYALFGLKPWGFHLVNILFHASVSVLVFFITLEIMGNTRFGFSDREALVPFTTAIIFSLHPIHTEAVVWIGGIPDLSFTLFLLLSLYLSILAEKNKQRQYPYYLAASVGSFFIATLCKEPAVTLPFLLIIYDFIFNRSKMNISFCIRKYSFYFLILSLYFILRFIALDGFSPVNRHADLSLFQSFLNIFPLFAKYLYLLVIPINLNVWHIFVPVQHAYDPKFLFSAGLAFSFVLSAIIAYRTNRIAFFSICILIFPLLPALYIPGTGENPFAERYLYLPSFGFAILFSLLLVKISSMVSHDKIVISGVFLLICVFYSAVTFSRNFDWKDDLTFWEVTVKKSPDEPLPRYNLGIALENKGRVNEAIVQYQKAISLKPASIAYKALGSLYYAQGLKNKSVLEYEKALELDPRNSELLNETGIVHMELGNYNKAIDHFIKAVELVPENPNLRYNYAMALRKDKRIPEALDQLQIAVKLDPSQAAFRDALNNIAKDDKAHREQ